MKHLRLSATLLALLLCASCEKSITDETGTTTGTPPTTVVSEHVKRSAISVAEAQDAAEGTSICVKAYLVASTARSIKNSDFEAPFEGSSAIVLADVPAASVSSESQLLPVSLTDCSKSIRATLNLPDNPQNWNRQLYIYGTREKYMSRPGLKKVTAFELMP